MKKAAVLGGADRAFQRLVEAGPAGAALELGVGCEQFLAAAGAGEYAVALLGVQRAGAGPLGAMLAQHLVLRGRQLRAPLLVGVLTGYVSVSAVCDEPNSLMGLPPAVHGGA